MRAIVRGLRVANIRLATLVRPADPIKHPKHFLSRSSMKSILMFASILFTAVETAWNGEKACCELELVGRTLQLNRILISRSSNSANCSTRLRAARFEVHAVFEFEPYQDRVRFDAVPMNPNVSKQKLHVIDSSNPKQISTKIVDGCRWCLKTMRIQAICWQLIKFYRFTRTVNWIRKTVQSF